DLIVDFWNNDLKKYSRVDNWKAYIDNEMNDEVELADLLGTIELGKNQLVTICTSKHHADEMKARLSAVATYISFENEEVKTTKTFGARNDSMFINLRQGTPEYFGLYGQTCLTMDIDDPIHNFNDFTIRELVENGDIMEAETWLKQTEYNIHRIVKNQFGEVEVTADFNTVRKELGLPISSFVTGGENRQSFIK